MVSYFSAEPGKSSGPISWAMRLGVKASGPKSDNSVEKESFAQAAPPKIATSVQPQGMNISFQLCLGTIRDV